MTETGLDFKKNFNCNIMCEEYKPWNHSRCGELVCMARTCIGLHFHHGESVMLKLSTPSLFDEPVMFRFWSYV